MHLTARGPAMAGSIDLHHRLSAILAGRTLVNARLTPELSFNFHFAAFPGAFDSNKATIMGHVVLNIASGYDDRAANRSEWTFHTYIIKDARDHFGSWRDQCRSCRCPTAWTCFGAFWLMRKGIIEAFVAEDMFAG
jgi:hypothetical protein